jgi:hypothetical protein
LVVAFVLTAAAIPLHADDAPPSPDASTIELGRRMYDEGINPDGEPMKATVQGDIPVDGTMFTCVSCHLKSGLGSLEGTVITLPTNWGYLKRPLVGSDMSEVARERLPKELQQGEFRSAYDEKSLARAMRMGKDPNGREFDLVMPRYALDKAEMDTLIAYLKELSDEFSPGVDETTMHFGTVIAGDVSPEDEEAMLAVLRAVVRDHNSQTRHEDERRRRGPYYKQEKWDPYRRWELHPWRLEGDPKTWREQLAAHYAAQPVFALLGGIADGEWRPIHEFCEEIEVPNLFPITDLPVISDSDWYTVYFSKGLYQEGEAVARYLRRADEPLRSAPVVQVYPDTPEGSALARGLRETRAAIRMTAPQNVVLEAGAKLTPDLLARIAKEHPGAVVALWVGEAGLGALDAVADEPRPAAVFLSSPLLGNALAAVPEGVRDITLLTYPTAFPEDKARTRLAVERWLKIREIPLTNYDVQANMYFLGWNIAMQVKMMRNEFYRDYLLDITDMMRDQDYAVGVYERLSFGPGQRYASKGCYITRLTAGPEPGLEKVSGWVVH